MKVKLDSIEQMLSVILLRYKELYVNEIEIENDYYWRLDEKEIYTLDEEPKDFTIGQLTDDWETVQHNFKTDDLIPYDLQKISSILTALSVEKPVLI